jgi:hypothetical protein
MELVAQAEDSKTMKAVPKYKENLPSLSWLTRTSLSTILLVVSIPVVVESCFFCFGCIDITLAKLGRTSALNLTFRTAS